MIAPLLVAVAHGLDLLTFLLALDVGLGIEGEWNHVMRTMYIEWGAAGVALLKGVATVALVCMVIMRRWALVPATGAGIVGASVNLTAISLVL